MVPLYHGGVCRSWTQRHVMLWLGSVTAGHSFLPQMVVIVGHFLKHADLWRATSRHNMMPQSHLCTPALNPFSSMTN
ncbi:hypothetical protein E2C01_039537 [Portunus trituberculatus]|uniref:Uncharacterized protein n=1 Tax=Portunus trituberculatus TaxID=210409 RepID=A0A5B7FEZ7_PORTR|nr:hypothetical protein [Portunus trituberculatus]